MRQRYSSNFLPSVDEVAHEHHRRGDGEDGDEGEGKLEAHEDVEEVVDAGEVLDASHRRDEHRREDRDGAGEEDALPAWPAEREEALRRRGEGMRGEGKGEVWGVGDGGRTSNTASGGGEGRGREDGRGRGRQGSWEGGWEEGGGRWEWRT